MIAENAIDWTLKWREEGRREGRREEAHRQGAASFLLRILERRFGKPEKGLEERIRAADMDQLLEWADRLVTASTLDDVFAGEPD